MVQERTSKLVVGHGADKSTTMGPVTTPQSIEKVTSQVEDAVSKGGKILHGGKRVNRPGYFFEPTVIANATSEMKVSQEETFGPILALFKFETEEEVVRLANDTSVSTWKAFWRLFMANRMLQMGLASYFFTRDVNRTWRLLENLEAGMIGMNTGKKYPRRNNSVNVGVDKIFSLGNQSTGESPFGGIKESGYGKESGKDVAVAEYVITKTGTLTVEGL